MLSSECARFPPSVLSPEYTIGWKIDVEVLETWISRKTIHISRKAYGLNLNVYLSYNAGALSFRMSHIQGLHIRFVDPIAPSPIIKTFSVTAGILWMELFGDVIECEFSFDPNQAFTSVPNEIYHKLEVLMLTLGYPKEGDGVYKGKCDDVNRVFDEYVIHYPGYDKIGIFIRKKKQDPYSLPYDTFIVETDGHCHINLRNGADKCILGASFLENYDVTFDNEHQKLMIRAYIKDGDAPSQWARST